MENVRECHACDRNHLKKALQKIARKTSFSKLMIHNNALQKTSSKTCPYSAQNARKNKRLETLLYFFC